MKLHERILIEASPERVWAVLADWEAQAGWMPDVAWMRLIGDERELGARLEVRTRVFGIPATTDVVVVTGWQPPVRMVIEHRGAVRGRGVWALQPRDGGTVFDWSEEMTMPPPLLGELAMRIYAPVQARMLRRSLANVKRLAEQAA